MIIGLCFLPGEEKLVALLIPFVWPFCYLMCFVLGIALSLINRGGKIELFRIFLAVFCVSLGDPWVFALSLVKRDAVPMVDPPMFSLQLVWLVVKGEEFTIANEMNPNP
jgi:hypothetical protein